MYKVKTEVFSDTRIKVLLAFLLLLGLMLLVYHPVQAQTTCSFGGMTFNPGQYFYNTAGQLYVCNADGTISWSGYTSGNPPVYPYPNVYAVPNMPTSNVQCAMRGNTYYVGEYFWDTGGQQYVCNSDGSWSFIGIISNPGGVNNCVGTTCSNVIVTSPVPTYYPPSVSTTTYPYVYSPYTYGYGYGYGTSPNLLVTSPYVYHTSY